MPIRANGLVAISRKYLLDQIAKPVVDHMEKEWPKSLCKWDERRQEIFSKADHGVVGGQFTRFQDIEVFFPEPVSSILFAQEYDVTSILPAAFYQLSITRVGREWDLMHKFRDGKREPSARWNLLEKDNLLRLM